jgi:hypothetical protein
MRQISGSAGVAVGPRSAPACAARCAALGTEDLLIQQTATKDLSDGHFRSNGYVKRVESGRYPPTTLGEPLTHWSLWRLKGYLERRRVVRSIAVDTLRSILRERNAFRSRACLARGQLMLLPTTCNSVWVRMAIAMSGAGRASGKAWN